MQQFAHHCLVIVVEAAAAHVSDTPLKQKTCRGEDTVFHNDVMVTEQCSRNNN